MLSVDISTIEARHSSNRETTMARARGWFCSLATLSAKYITHVVTRLGSGLGVTTPSAASDPQSEQTTSHTKTKRGGGGSWRAFVHERAKGRKLDKDAFKQLSQEYQRLGDEEKSRYIEAGAAASLAHKEGFASFGGSNKTSDQQGAPTRLQPGDVQESTGAIVLTDYEVNAGALLAYTGPDFFNEQYESLKKQVNAEGKLAIANETLTKEEQQQLQSFEAKAESERFLAGWCAAKYSFLTSAFIKLGTGFSDLVSLQWMPAIVNSIKAGHHTKQILNWECVLILVHSL